MSSIGPAAGQTDPGPDPSLASSLTADKQTHCPATAGMDSEEQRDFFLGRHPQREAVRQNIASWDTPKHADEKIVCPILNQFDLLEPDSASPSTQIAKCKHCHQIVGPCRASHFLKDQRRSFCPVASADDVVS